MREPILAARAARTPAERNRAATAIRDHVLTLPELAQPGWVVGYVATATEPGTAPLLTALTARGCRALVPRVSPGARLRWAEWLGAGALRPGPLGIAEPTGPDLPDDVVGAAVVALVPALAVDRDGFRLGRGGGYYDRLLTDGPLHPDALTVAVVFATELVDRVPREPHDRPVRAAVSDEGVVRFD